MSVSTVYHATAAAERMSDAELVAAIVEIEHAPLWQGGEFDDVRMRHRVHTKLQTYRRILNERGGIFDL